MVGRFSQLVSYAGMRLSQHLGVPVRPLMSRKAQDKASARAQQGVAEFANTGRLTGALLVPTPSGLSRSRPTSEPIASSAR